MDKKLSLDETWNLTLEMWKWIVEQLFLFDQSTYFLKREWLTDNNYNPVELRGVCFFCEYDTTRVCKNCPGRLVDKTFRCQHPDYHFSRKPEAFYKKLIQLNRKRLKNKNGKKKNSKSVSRKVKSKKSLR